MKCLQNTSSGGEPDFYFGMILWLLSLATNARATQATTLLGTFFYFPPTPKKEVIGWVVCLYMFVTSELGHEAIW